jgi:hypothetical protein
VRQLNATVCGEIKQKSARQLNLSFAQFTHFASLLIMHIVWTNGKQVPILAVDSSIRAVIIIVYIELSNI